jgi:hypothetical protein
MPYFNTVQMVSYQSKHPVRNKAGNFCKRTMVEMRILFMIEQVLRQTIKVMSKLSELYHEAG